MNLTFVELLAACGYLLPVILLASVSARRDTALVDVALQVPVAIAADLFTTLLLTRVFPLEASALLVRGLWLAGSLAVWIRRRRAADHPAWPRALGGWTLAVGAAAGVLVVLPFLSMSRTFNIWDRDWHSPLAASLQGQTLPFHNVYDAGVVLHYHFSGDVVAAMLRTFSFDVLSSSRSLGLAHDLFLGLTAAWIAVVSRALGTRRLWACVLGGAALVWHGPWPRQLQGDYDGYAYHLFAQLSYRPHVPLALFAMTCFVGALTIQSAPGLRVSPRRTLATLVASVSILGTSDETSVGVLGLSLGIAWLFVPEILGFRRGGGVLAMLSLGAALFVPNRLFSASLSPGGPVQSIERAWPPRLPSLLGQGATTPLSSEEGHFLLLIAIGPIVACWLALAVAVLVTRSRRARGLVLFGAAVTLLCLGLATMLTINKDVEEGQRFFVAPFAATIVPVVGLLGLVRTSAVARALLVLGLGIPSAYTLYFCRWETETLHATGYAAGPANPIIPESLFDVNCRAAAGAHLLDPPRPVYVDKLGFYLFSTCRPVFNPGGYSPQWPVKIFPHLEPLAQLRELGAIGGDGEAICRVDAKRDAVCARVASQPGRCRAEGTFFVRCPITAEDRAALLGTP
jgi:hypothetical protein